ncbi:MAG: hypothetical protein LBC71_06890 [Oscillospiraceae bacterium]|nr:hypothetical protein [Oscillospiraceae bacterium]
MNSFGVLSKKSKPESALNSIQGHCGLDPQSPEPNVKAWSITNNGIGR